MHLKIGRIGIKPTFTDVLSQMAKFNVGLGHKNSGENYLSRGNEHLAIAY
jgi:hypothetical protein